MEYKPNVVFDFDGVIHSYMSGWKGVAEIPDQPVPGIGEAIAELRQLGYRVMSVMARERLKCDAEQAERIAWRNVKDWIAAQVALVETEQATMDELFFPKLVDRNERTLYEAFQAGHLMLGEGGSV